MKLQPLVYCISLLDVSPSDPLLILVLSSYESAATFCSFRFVFLECLTFVGVDAKIGVIDIANSVKKKKKRNKNSPCIRN